MAKRLKLKGIRAARTYTIEEAADALGVSICTVRNWAKAGLPMMTARRPFLILGESLRSFLQARQQGAKSPLEAGHLYCLSCKAGRTPMGQMVDCIPQSAKTARLVGLCEVCGGTCNRMISRAKINHFREIFDLVIKGGPTA